MQETEEMDQNLGQAYIKHNTKAKVIDLTTWNTYITDLK